MMSKLFNGRQIFYIIIFLIIFNFFVWYSIVVFAPNSNAELYFLDIGQGDAELIILPGNVKVLIDGGPDKSALYNLEKILSPFDRYIDLVILSHPQLDHFGGLIDVLRRYKVGAFISNGRTHSIAAYKDLERAVLNSQALNVNLMEGDGVTYKESKLDIISPQADFLKSKELNDSTLVVLFESDGARALFTGDIGLNVEKYLIDNFDITSDILKVGHHGSKYSSSEDFLNKVNPKISVIEVGKNNYGHPTKEALERLGLIGSKIFRTDFDGLIKLTISGKNINIFKNKFR